MKIDRRAMLSLAGASVAAPRLSLARTTPHQLKVGDRLERFDRLTPGVRVYLRSQQRELLHAPVDIWRRETRVDAVNGVDRLRIVQRWDGAGRPGSLVERDSLFEVGTFRPLTHIRTTTRDGVRIVEGYAFEATGIVGMTGLADNTRDGFSVVSDEPMYNFEVDMEMLQTLPWASGYAVSIPFYHPSPSTTPARYLWKATAEDRLRGPDGRDLDCWVIETDYNAPERPPSRFWLSKATQQFVKLEALGLDGVMQRKTLLTV